MKYTQQELNEILAKHKNWLNGVNGGEQADFSSADLSYVDFSSADLRYVDFSSANLRYANLRYADLRYANFSSADLRYVDLRYVDLRYANFSSADLRCIIGEMKSLRSFQLEKYMVSYTDTILNIGCESHTIEDWKNFNDKKIKIMDRGALEWWNKWKPIIMQIIEIAPAEPTIYTIKEEE